MVSACLPSLRPLIVRIIWGDVSVPSPGQGRYFNSSETTTSKWRGGGKVHDGTFCRLPESGKVTWSNDVAVYGGMRIHGAQEEVVELSSPREEEMDTPINRIRAKTTVTLTISERIDWKDRLF